MLFLLSLSAPLIACTGIRLTANDGWAVTGRTAEFGLVLDLHTAVIPRGFSFVGKTPNGEGLAYRSKYAVVGVYCFDELVLMDGMNEQGLVAASFYFPGFASYTPLNADNQPMALSPLEFPNWILTQCATLEEVREALPSVVIVPTISKAWGTAPPPFHYIVYDKKGQSLVIEPIDGTLVVRDNPIGVITNSPTFDWHMTNLRNYIHLTPFNVPPITLDGMKFAPFGQGSGLIGMPGDFTPPSRFVRAVIFSATATPSNTAEAAVAQAFHILNQFDIPVGTAREKTQTGYASDYTQMTCVKDPQSLRYYYKSYDDQTIRFIDLNAFDLNVKAIKKGNTRLQQPMIDASSFLK